MDSVQTLVYVFDVDPWVKKAAILDPNALKNRSYRHFLNRKEMDLRLSPLMIVIGRFEINM